MFVAGFIGSPSMNFLPGEIDAGGGTVALAEGPRLRNVEDALGGHAGRPITLGIRPEHLVLVPEGEQDFHMAVRVVETLGADTLAHGRIVEAGATAATAIGEGGAGIIAVRLPGGTRVAEGDALPLRMEPGMLHLFDPDAGRRLADL